MKNKNIKTEYLFPSRMDANDPYKVSLMQVDKEIYQEIMPEIWREQKRLMRQGKCVCPPSDMTFCDIDCAYCQHQRAGKEISSDTQVSDSETSEELSILEMIPYKGASTEDIAITLVLLESYEEAIKKLAPKERAEVDAIKHNDSMRKASKEVKIPYTTFERDVSKIVTKLQNMIL